MRYRRWAGSYQKYILTNPFTILREAALTAQSAFKLVYPAELLTFKYTTVYGIKGF
jgi:hypothetical protein